MGEKIIIHSPNWIGNWIGDAVISTALLPIIKDNLPDSPVYVLCKRKVRDIFHNNPFIEGIFHPENMQEIKEEHFSLGILLPNSFSSAFLMFRCGVKERVGYPTDGRRFLLTRKAPLPANWRNMPQIEFYLRILDYLGMERRETKPGIYLEPREKEQVKSKYSLPEKFSVLIPGAAYGNAKRWPVENFARVSCCITKECSFPVLILGSKDEKPLGEKIAATDKEVINLVGKTSVREMMAIIALSSLVVCNDSGALHIASTLGIPVVGIYGPTPVEKTKPWYGEVAIIHKKVACSPCMYRECPRDHRCMKSISPEEVVDTVKKMIE
ncbi:MAG: lipopolysaccharide heptosyltransferase II [Caldiserica bacterium]|nr:lipopolysaccharide heptosyltransferase II [Caldisericota bacterium]